MKKTEHRWKQTEAVFETSANSVLGFPGTLVGNESACNAQTPFFLNLRNSHTTGTVLGCGTVGPLGGRERGAGAVKGRAAGAAFQYPLAGLPG